MLIPDAYYRTHTRRAILRILFLAVVIVFFRTIPAMQAETVRDGNVSMTVRNGVLSCNYGGKTFFKICKPRKDVSWKQVLLHNAPDLRRIKYVAKDKDRIIAELHVILTAHSARMTWRNINTPTITGLRIPDATYRTGDGFQYQAQYKDGRKITGKVGFDVLRRDPTLKGIESICLKQPLSNVTLRVIDGKKQWEWIDSRRQGTREGYSDLTFAPAQSETEKTVTILAEFSRGDTFHIIDFHEAANQALRDEKSDDGKGGWTDQGPNDLRSFNPGLHYFLGVPFRVIDPAKNNGKSVIVLRGADRTRFPVERTVPVGRKFQSFYVLHAGAWVKENLKVADYVLHYKDGTTRTYDIVEGRDILDWWQGREKPLSADGDRRAAVAWLGRNDGGQPVCLTAVSLRNPNPSKVVASITFRSMGKAVPVILAATTSTGQYQIAPDDTLGGGAVLPLPALKLCCMDKRTAGVLFNVLLKSGAPLEVFKEYSKLNKADIAIVHRTPKEEDARKLLEFVRRGGKAVIEMPLPFGSELQKLLPFDKTTARIATGPKKWLPLVPIDTNNPIFSGLPWDQNVFNYPIAPTHEYIQTGPLQEKAKILARWQDAKSGPPAMIEWPVGKGKVIVLTENRTKLDDTKRAMSPNTDYFYLKLYYWLAGHDNAARTLGMMAEAAQERNRIGQAYAECRAALEDAGAIVQFIKDATLDARLQKMDTAMQQLDEQTDAIDTQLLELDFSQSPAAEYQRIVKELDALQKQAGEIQSQARKTAARSSSYTSNPPRSGRPLRTGIFVTAWPQKEGSLFGDYRHEAFLEHIKQLGFDVNMIYASGYGRDDNLFWRWKDGREGGEVEYLFDEGNLDFYLNSSKRYGQKVILTLSYCWPETPDKRYYVPFLRKAAEHFKDHDTVIALSPNNENILHRPPTDDDFRSFLKKRYLSVEQMNKVLGTNYSSFEKIQQPEIINLGGDKFGGKEMIQTKFGSPERALYYEHMLFRMDWLESALEDNWKAIKDVSNLHINSRDTPVAQRYNGGPRRLDRIAKWHDSIGTHVQIAFDLDKSRAYSHNKPLWLTEYYWHHAGGGWAGMQYRLHGSLMLPVASAERMNLAAVNRNFWRAVSRGTELFAIFKAYPYPGSGWWEHGDGGRTCITWPNHSPKRPIYAFKTQRKVVERMSKDLFGSQADAKVAVVEPIAARIQLDGSLLEKTTGRIYNEITKLFGDLHYANRIITDPIPSTFEYSKYKYIVLPSALCLDRDVSKRLLAYVREGGTVIATLPLGLYDEHSKTDGQILNAIHLQARRRPMGKYQVRIGNQQEELSTGIVFSLIPRKPFAGRVLGTYSDGKPCLVETQYGKGKFIISGFSANIAGDLFAQVLIPMLVNRATLEDWNMEGPINVGCFVKRKNGYRLFVLLNRDFRKTQNARLIFNRPQSITDLRSGCKSKARTSVSIRLLPGECRIYKVQS